MNKKLSFVLAILLVLSLLAGCGSGGDGGSAAPADSGDASADAGDAAEGGSGGDKITLRFWMRNSSNDHWCNYAIQEFNESQDEIEVIFEAYGENYDNILSMALTSGDIPEIFEAQSNPPVNKLAEAGHIVPIDDLFDEEFKSRFHPSAFAQEDMYYNGELYSIPCRFSTYKLLYNKTLFEAAGLDPDSPPTTWEEVRDYAKQITEAGAGEFYGFGYYINNANFWNRNLDSAMVSQGGSGMMGFDYLSGQFNFENDKKMFEFYADMYDDGSIFPGALELGIEPMRANFAQDKVGMYVDGNWMSSQYAETEDVIAVYGFTEIPVFEGQEEATAYMLGEETFVVASDNEYPEESLQVYKMLMEAMPESRKWADAQCKTMMEANTEESLAQLPAELNYQDLDNCLRIDNNAVFPVEPHKFITLEGEDRNTVFNRLIANAFDGDRSGIDEAIEDLNTRYNAALEKALADGALTEEQVKPEGFDYFNR